MHIVVIMDGPETVDPKTDTSFALMLAAQERGHEISHCAPHHVESIEGRVRAIAHRALIDPAGTPPLALGPSVDLDLHDVDVILLRTDPPFDPAYLHLTLLLDHVVGDTLVLNSPHGLREANEKLYSLRFPDVTPPTIVSANAHRITEFAASHGAAVVKPIDGHGGRGVMVVRPGDDNAPSIIDTMTERGRVPVVAQQFLPRVSDGDRRILLLDGVPLGAILRLPTADDFRANICVGGEVQAVELDDRDRRIVERIAPELRADGLLFVGIDVIDGQLSEVNVTSPTGLRQLADLTNTRPDLDVIRWLERATS